MDERLADSAHTHAHEIYCMYPRAQLSDLAHASDGEAPHCTHWKPQFFR